MGSNGKNFHILIQNEQLITLKVTYFPTKNQISGESASIWSNIIHNYIREDYTKYKLLPMYLKNMKHKEEWYISTNKI